jgi:YVTN family beta-propeller protein
MMNVVSTASNGVTLIDLATNTVRGTVYVDRNPHEGFFTPDGRQLWVTVRGESHVAVIDPVAMRITARIETAKGPGMVVFRPDGEVAFVNHSFTPELHVVDVATHRVTHRIPVVSPFSPDLAVTADGAQVWLTHKDVGKVTVVNARTLQVERVLDTGPVTNHVNFAGPGGGTGVGGAAAGDFAYVTVGGQNVVKVYRRSDFQLTATIPVGPVPHGVWPSGDGSRIYVGLQQGDAVAVIDTKSNTKIAEIPVGQSPQALVYVANAVPSGSGTQNLEPLGNVAAPLNLVLQGVPGVAGSTGGKATVRSLGLVDAVDVNLSGLETGARYTLYVTDRPTGPFQSLDPLAVLQADAKGQAAVETITTAKRTLSGADRAHPRYLVVLRGENDPAGVPVLVQTGTRP